MAHGGHDDGLKLSYKIADTFGMNRIINILAISLLALMGISVFMSEREIAAQTHAAQLPTPSAMTADSAVHEAFAALQNSSQGNLHSIAQVRTLGCNNGSTGSAWVAAPNLLLTAAHVIVGATHVEVGFGYYGQDDVQIARVVGYNPATDLALLNIDTRDRTPIALSDKAMENTDYYSVGHPRSRPLEISTLRGFSTNIDAQRGYVYTLDGHVEPGDSGSPMFNIAGEAVGLIYATNQSEDGTPSPARVQAYATPTGAIHDILNQSNYNRFATVQPGTCGDMIRANTPYPVG